jgi:hypothetical protein
MSSVLEHDDRVSGNMRRVSFKPGSNWMGKTRKCDLGTAIRAYVGDDDDVDVNTPGSHGRGSGRL